GEVERRAAEIAGAIATGRGVGAVGAVATRAGAEIGGAVVATRAAATHGEERPRRHHRRTSHRGSSVATLFVRATKYPRRHPLQSKSTDAARRRKSERAQLAGIGNDARCPQRVAILSPATDP